MHSRLSAAPKPPAHRIRARKTVLAASLALAGFSASAQTASEVELGRKLDQLAAELATVKAQLAQMQRERAAPPLNAAATGATTGAASSTPSAPTATAPTNGLPTTAMAAPAAATTAEPATVLSSYGEINYNRPIHQSQNTQADVRRFVLGYTQRFDAKNKVVTELEVEHAVSSSGDPGEVAVEQAYLEHQIDPTWAVRGGLFLMPVGLLNENHEPTAFYGVERNFVETRIIPSTWREGGVQVVGNFENGITAQAAITTSFDLNKWDAASSDGRESPLGSIHQEMALAKAHDLGVVGALNWRGLPGLLLGGSLFTGNATHAQTTTKARVTLWDAHARWTPGRWDLSTVYTRGTISNTAALNGPLVGNPTLIPKSFDGWYVQGAYKLWSSGDYSLAPFVRWEQVNTARSYADLGPGLTPSASRTERVATLGANFQISPQIVVKADYQQFRDNRDFNRFDLGLGWSF